MNKLNAFSPLRKLVVFQFDLQHTILFFYPALYFRFSSSQNTWRTCTIYWYWDFSVPFQNLQPQTSFIGSLLGGFGWPGGRCDFSNSNGPFEAQHVIHDCSAIIEIASSQSPSHKRSSGHSNCPTSSHIGFANGPWNGRDSGRYRYIPGHTSCTFIGRSPPYFYDSMRRHRWSQREIYYHKIGWTACEAATPDVVFVDYLIPSPINFNFSQGLQKVVKQLKVFRTNCNADLFITTPRLNAVLYDNNWSNLEDLELTHRRSTRLHGGSLSMAALLSVAIACPKLVKLTIAIRHPDEHCMETATLSDTVRKPHGLKVLKIVALPLTSNWLSVKPSNPLVINFFFFLHCLFPRLQIADYDPTFLGSDSNNAVADWCLWWAAL